jgi:hypothetical protein
MSQPAATTQTPTEKPLIKPIMYKMPANKPGKAFTPPVWPEYSNPSVFLAGSIEMGKAIDWQGAMTQALEDLPVTVLNPRRDDWSSDWVQDISNPQFKEQVDWEMDHLNKADVIALYLQPGTYSPISLLELGMHAHHASTDGSGEQKLVVCCPTGFWRRGNVQMVCHRYNIKLVETMDELISEVKRKLNLAVEAKKTKA